MFWFNFDDASVNLDLVRTLTIEKNKLKFVFDAYHCYSFTYDSDEIAKKNFDRILQDLMRKM